MTRSTGLARIVQTSLDVGSTRSRKKKQALLAELLRELAPDEVPVGVAYLSGVLPQGRIGLGKTFEGMTDEVLAWQTEHLGALEIGRERHVVHVRPETVVEIALSDVQASPIYPAGMALRFARVKRYRTDKSAKDAATIDEVRAIFDRGHRPPP